MPERAEALSTGKVAAWLSERKIREVDLHIPALPSWHVPRVRLENLISGETGRANVVHVFAPAGFGKTTLVAAWAQSQSQSQSHWRVQWLSLSAREAEVEWFVAAIAAAFARIGLGFEDFWKGLAAEDRLQELINATFLLKHDVCLVLDNLDLVAGGPAGRLLDLLLDGIAPSMRLIVIGRSLLGFSQGRNLVYRRASLIDAAQLRMTDDEACAVLGVTDGPDAQTAVAVNRMVEGWAAGLQFAQALSVTGGGMEGSARLLAANNRELGRFFRDEIMAFADQEDRQFLMKSALLGAFSVEQCTEILQLRDVAQRVDRNIAAGRFLSARSSVEDCFAYDGPFQRFLVAEAVGELGEACEAIHLAAADWHAARGDIVAAFQHAFKLGQTRMGRRHS